MHEEINEDERWYSTGILPSTVKRSGENEKDRVEYLLRWLYKMGYIEFKSFTYPDGVTYYAKDE